MKTIRIATRKSPLAMWQANDVTARLRKAHPGLEVEIVGLMTQGDRLLSQRLAAQGGKGLFLKELEASLLRNETDIAVHSMKDVPVKLPPGLMLAAFCKREDARDAFVSNHYTNLYALPKGARVGTASLRRTSQLQNAFPALKFEDLRGNVNTRLAKLDDGEFDAIILAAAGLIRLDFATRIKQYIPVELCLPAVGQGIMGIECREGDDEVIQLLESLNDDESELCLRAERAMNKGLGGGCHVPIAGYAVIENRRLNLRGVVGEPDGTRVLVSSSERSLSITDPLADEADKVVGYKQYLEVADGLGQVVAQSLLKQGANQILESLYEESIEHFKTVVLTRQESYLGNMMAVLKSLDFKPVHIPTLEITPYESPEQGSLLSELHRFTDIVFVSRNAVDVGMELIKEHGGIPKDVRVMAVGAETAKQLYRLGVEAMFPQQGTGAEALLAVAQLADLSDRNILIVRGDEGLDWPAQTMRKRGALVKELICYEQHLAENSLALMQSLARQDAKVAGVFVHSASSAKQLIQLARSKFPALLESGMVAGSDRIAERAKESGWKGPISVSESPSNKNMMISFSRMMDPSNAS